MNYFMMPGARPEHISNKIDRVIQCVCVYFRITYQELTTRTRKREIVWPRQILSYLLRTDCQLTYKHTGEILGGYDHTSIMHAIGSVKNMMETDSTAFDAVVSIRSKYHREYIVHK